MQNLIVDVFKAFSFVLKIYYIYLLAGKQQTGMDGIEPPSKTLEIPILTIILHPYFLYKITCSYTINKKLVTIRVHRELNPSTSDLQSKYEATRELFYILTILIIFNILSHFILLIHC